jgi:hypothetical protein
LNARYDWKEAQVPPPLSQEEEQERDQRERDRRQAKRLVSYHRIIFAIHSSL